MSGWLTGRFPKFSQDRLLLVVDLIGTSVFAVEGALAGIDAGLDVFGLLVLSFVTALGGGTIRDLLIGAIPPNSIRDWRYGATAFAGGGADGCGDGRWRRDGAGCASGAGAGGVALGCVCGGGAARGGRGGVGTEDEGAAWGGDESGGGSLFSVADGGGLAALESAQGDGALRHGVGFRE
jgi:hypothetical protein